MHTGCIPGALWRRAGEIATPANLAIVKAAMDRLNDGDDELEKAGERAKRYLEAVNSHVARLNAETEARNRENRLRSTYQQPAPSPYYPPQSTFTLPSPPVLYPCHMR